MGYAEKYKATGQTARAQHEVEAGALISMASRIDAVRQDWEGKRGLLADTLDMNRKLWTILAGLDLPDARADAQA
ncbi:hypothetical protein FACS1894186_8450 [Alphaproteobacteria bacterium]|nr:hypothetical protein FACS1894186_8450 [Alphaproteobacteria bacterium]